MGRDFTIVCIASVAALLGGGCALVPQGIELGAGGMVGATSEDTGFGPSIYGSIIFCSFVTKDGAGAGVGLGGGVAAQSLNLDYPLTVGGLVGGGTPPRRRGGLLWLYAGELGVATVTGADVERTVGLGVGGYAGVGVGSPYVNVTVGPRLMLGTNPGIAAGVEARVRLMIPLCGIGEKKRRR